MAKDTGKKLADMMYGGNPEQAAFGVFPQMKGRRSKQDPEAAKNVPIDLLRGAVSGVLGAPGDIESFARLPYELITGNESPTILPTSEDILKRIPYGSDTPASRAASGVGQLGGGFYTGPGSPLRLVGAIPKATKRAAKDFAEASAAAAPRVIKQKGGNWQGGSVEEALKPLKTNVNVPTDIAELNTPTPQRQNELALNNWVDRNLTNYVKKEMATPEDPIRKLAEEGVVHVPTEQVGINRYKAPERRETMGGEQLGQSEAAKAWEDASDAALRANTVRQLTDLSKSSSIYHHLTEPWMMNADPATKIYSLGREAEGLGFDHIIDVLREDLATGRIRPEQLNKVSMEQAVRRTYEYDQEMAKKMREAQIKATEGMPTYKEYPEGFRWIELTTPEPKLGEGYRIIKDEPSPSNWSVVPHPDGDGYALRAQNGQYAFGNRSYAERKWDTPDQAAAEIPSYAEIQEPYPDEVYKILDSSGNIVAKAETEKKALNQLNRDEREKALADALKYEGETMGHCVGGYCPDVMEGRSRIYSLRDAKGEPHVTVETEPRGIKTWDDVTAAVGPEEAGKLWKEFDDIGGHNMDNTDAAFDLFIKQKGIQAPDRIVQIKGKQNRAPKEEYLPFVQDFVRSGKWSDVGDIQNTGMRATTDVFSPSELEMLKGAGAADIPHILSGEDIQRYHNMIVPEGKRLKYDARGNIIGGEEASGYAHGGRVHISDNLDTMALELAGGGLVKGLVKAAKGMQDVLPAAEREANLAKFREQSKAPMRLYHGTTASEGGKGQEAIRRIKPSKEGALGSGVYMTPKADFAGSYAEELGGNVLPVHAQIRNPLVIEGKGDPMIEALVKLGMDEESASKMVEKAYEQKGYIGKQVENRARAAGYDGLMQYRDGDLTEVVSYNPNAVKSAIGNQGTYNVLDPDLNKAGGGLVKGLAKAAKAAKEAPAVVIPSTISELQAEVAKKAGQYGAKRVQRAADEIKNLERMYKPKALRETFTGDNNKAVVTMNPADFEKYAQTLAGRTQADIGPKMQELARQGEIDKYTVPTDEYIEHLMRLYGFDQVPYLNLFKDETGLPMLPNIVGHEGRHRSRALAGQGETSGLVEIKPRGAFYTDLPRSSQEEYIEALREELGLTRNMVIPENDGSVIRRAIQLPEPYAEGGEVHMAGGGALSKLAKAAKAAKEAAVPIDIPRVRPTRQEILEAAERVGKQQAGEFVRSPILKDTTNLAGRSKKEIDRLNALKYELKPIKDLPKVEVYEPKVGDVNIALPGDQTISDMLLQSIEGEPVGSVQQGGALFGLGRLQDPENLRSFWASNAVPAQNFQNKVDAIAQAFDTDQVTAYHLAMGQTANNFAQHLADANLRAIDYSKLSKSKMDQFDQEIAYGFSKKDKDTGKKVWTKFPEWPGIANPDAAMAAMKENPELRKWFNDRMKKESLTKKSDLPYGKAIEWAATEPELRNMEINLTGLSAGRMKPGAKLIPESSHETYSHDIPGTFLGKAPELAPFSISFPDAASFVREKYRPQDFTGTIQKVFPHQVVDEAYLEDMYNYYTQLRNVRGYAGGGEVHGLSHEDMLYLQSQEDLGKLPAPAQREYITNMGGQELRQRMSGKYAGGGEITADDLILEERKL